MRPLVLGFASIASCVALLVAPADAEAQTTVWNNTPSVWTSNGGEPRSGLRGAQQPASAWDRVGQWGLELQVRGGLMYAGGDSPVQAPNLYPSTITGNPTGTILNPASCPGGQVCTPYSLDPFGLAVALGWRFLPQLSAGAFFSYASYGAANGGDTGDAADFTSQLTRAQWVLGAYGRYYLTGLSPRLQPWVELGVGFSYDSASYQRPLGQASNGQPETGFYNLNSKGLAVPVTIGLDWRLAPVFSVGPMVGYEAVVPLGGCVEVDVDQFSAVPGQNTCNSSVVSTKYYGVITGGIFAKVTFWPAPR